MGSKLEEQDERNRTADRGRERGEETKGEVKSLRDEKTKRRNEGRIGKNLRYCFITDAINRQLFSQLPDFPKKYHVITTESGHRRTLLEGNGGVCRYVDEDHLISSILCYCRDEVSPQFEGYNFNKNDCKAAADYWLMGTNPIEEPAMVLELDDPGLCFHRLTFVPDHTMETPVFDEFLSRCSDPMALKCFIGSLFYPQADRQQYLWMFGDGGNGKGSIMRFLAKLMGPAYSSEVPPIKGDKFWTSGLQGKRLVAFPDCNDAKFPASHTFIPDATSPELNAHSSICPERRLSRPIITPLGLWDKTCPITSPIFTIISGIIGYVFATPRIPSVPNNLPICQPQNLF